MNGTRIVNDWSDHPAHERTGEIALAAGRHQVKVDYYENGRDAVARVWWERLGQKRMDVEEQR